MKKKLDGGLKITLIVILFFFILSKNTLGSQILDYETEKFIKEILNDIISVNKINKKIKFIIKNNDEINAYVDHQNIIHINSGLIKNSNDYVAILSVLAHEVGHIDLNHINLRKKKIEDKKRYNSLTTLSVIAGSVLTNSPEFLQTSIISSATLSNQYLYFSKEQEIEADLYALKTLSQLNTNSNSTIELLETIEQKQLSKGFSKEKQRVSSHPFFEERISLINNYNKNKKINFDFNINKQFNFIKAKFIGYGSNINSAEDLDEPYKTYAQSIIYARNGSLKMSLENLNKVIEKYQNNFLLETKADILFSYGFTNDKITGCLYV